MSINIVLASASPRRKMLMAQAGIPCIIAPSNADETLDGETAPGEAAVCIALRKGKAALARLKRPAVIVAADTVVCIDGRILGKPRDKSEAFLMLKTLQGRRHTVYTGVALIKTENGREDTDSFTEEAGVYMRALNDNEINAYIATGEPMDKAGAYGAQEKGALLIERVEGDYHTVVGLPLARLCLALKKWGINATDFWAEANRPEITL